MLLKYMFHDGMYYVPLGARFLQRVGRGPGFLAIGKVSPVSLLLAKLEAKSSRELIVRKCM